MFPVRNSFSHLRLPLPVATLGAASIAAALGLSSNANAHIRLLEPLARYEIEGLDTGIKSCPCGMGGSNRTCNVAADGTDDNRSDRITTAVAGSTLTLRFEEYIAHSGRYRIAFDPDGADHDDFNANILLDVPDPSGSDGNIGEGTVWELEVQLPDTPCDNCTLQLVQAMHGDTENPVADPADLSSYYTCVDLVLTEPEGEPEPVPTEPATPDPAPTEPEPAPTAPDSPMPTSPMPMGPVPMNPAPVDTSEMPSDGIAPPDPVPTATNGAGGAGGQGGGPSVIAPMPTPGPTATSPSGGVGGTSPMASSTPSPTAAPTGSSAPMETSGASGDDGCAFGALRHTTQWPAWVALFGLVLLGRARRRRH